MRPMRGLLAALMASFFAGMPSLFSTYAPPGAGLSIGKRSRVKGPRRPAGSKLAKLASKGILTKSRIR